MKYATIDTETTGIGKGKNGRLVQVAIVVHENGRVVDKYNSYINPKCRIPKQAYNVHHIGWRQVRHAPTIQQAKPIIQKKLRGCKKVIGYNVSFDKRMMEQNGCPVHRGREVIDVMGLAHKKYGERMKLDAVARRAKVKVKGVNFHNAFADAMTTMKLYEKLKKGKKCRR